MSPETTQKIVRSRHARIPAEAVDMNRQLLGELIPEAVAVCIVIALGNSVACMYVLYDLRSYLNSYGGLCMAWSLAVILAIYATGSVTGTQANPAVTLALAALRDFAWKKVVPYWVAQMIGAFAGAALAYRLLLPVIDHFNQTHQLTRAGIGAAGVFFTHPGLAITPVHALLDQMLLIAFLIFGIFAITEQCNEMAPGANSGALMIGLLVATIGAFMGYLEAWAIHPAREFGPRLFTFVTGRGKSALPSPHDYRWISIVGPLIGGVIGGAMNQRLIYPFLPARQTALDGLRKAAKAEASRQPATQRLLGNRRRQPIRITTRTRHFLIQS